MSEQSGLSIAESVKKAMAAFEADDSKAVNEYCRQIIDVDPENLEAWKLLAKVDGWDSKLYDFDTDRILRSIKHYLGLIPEQMHYEEAAEIYTVRKRQISLRLEAALMMPSYQGAKQTHQIMMDWKRLLAEIPYLTPSLIKSEVTLCENICTRSKMAFMPNDRLVYTAYATFNRKEPYGETFRKALLSRVEREMQREAQKVSETQKDLEQKLQSYKQKVAAGEITVEEEKDLLKSDLEALRNQLIETSSMSDEKLFQQQYDELQSQLATMKPYKIFKRAELQERIKAVNEKLSQIRTQNESAKAQIQPQIDMIEAKLREIKQSK